jgi:glycosyltransferase involved in cell wall biosynthesis
MQSAKVTMMIAADENSGHTMRAVALIPAHNEADMIETTLSALGSLPQIAGIIVADDASSDETASCAERAGAVCSRLAFQQGKGAALEHACALLTEQLPFGPLENIDAVLLIDADVGTSAAQATTLLEALAAGYDMAIAGFPAPTKKAGFGIVKRRARATILKLGGFEASWPLSGQRALSLACLKAVRPFASNFGVELALSVRALWAGMRLIELPTTMTHRASDRSLQGFVHRGRQYLDVSKTARTLRREFRKSSL